MAARLRQRAGIAGPSWLRIVNHGTGRWFGTKFRPLGAHQQMKLSTITEAAQLLSRAEVTLHGWIRMGAPVVKMGHRGRGNKTLVHAGDLLDWRNQRRTPASQRNCTKCGYKKPAAEFPARRYSKNGLPRPRSACRACEAERARVRRKRSRRIRK